MHSEYGYNIHDVIRFKVITNGNPKILGGLQDIFSHFQTDEDFTPDIQLTIGRFERQRVKSFVIDHKYHIGEDYVYYEEERGISKWRMEISGLERGATTVNFHSSSGNLNRILFPLVKAQSLVLRPLIEMKMLRKDYLPVHGLGLSIGGEGTLVAGRGGAHKTAIAIDLLREKRFELLGDDRVIVGRNGDMLSYPLLEEVFSFRSNYHLLKDTLNPLDKVKLIAYLESRRGRDHRGCFSSGRSRLRRVVTTTRKIGIKSPIVTQSGKEETVARLVNINQSEIITGTSSPRFKKTPFASFIKAYSFVFPRSAVAQFWNRSHDLLVDSLTNAATYALLLPQEYSASVASCVSSLVSDGGAKELCTPDPC